MREGGRVGGRKGKRELNTDDDRMAGDREGGR